MSENVVQSQRSLNFKIYAVALALLWTLLVVVAVAWTFLNARRMAEQSALNSLRSSYAKDLLFRRWAADHGGVYVKESPGTPANPYLSDVRDRDIVTPSGVKLTLMNPAYMTRQLYEMKGDGGIPEGHITSLNPIRPQNAPDTWERSALEYFERGASEWSGITYSEGKPLMRYMGALMVEPACLVCHKKQGYVVGQVRGGISVATPMEPYFALARNEQLSHDVALMLVWLGGLAGILFWAVSVGGKVKDEERARNLLAASEKRLREMMDNVNIIAVVLDPEAKVLYINPHFTALTGIPPEEITGRDWFAFAGKSAQEAREEFLRSVGKGEILHHGQSEIATVGGASLTISWSNTLTLKEDGAPSFVTCIGIDITERLKAQEILKRSEENFRSIVEKSIMGFLIFEAVDCDKARVTGCNGAALRILGKTRENILGSGVDDLLPGLADPELFVKLMEDCHQDKPYHSHKLEYEAKDSILEIFAFSSGPRRLVAMFHDVTESRRMEKKLKALAQALEQAADAVVFLSSGAKVEYVNSTFTSLLGFTFEEAAGRRLEDFLGEKTQPENLEALLKALSVSGAWKGRVIFSSREGVEVLADLSIAPVRDDRGGLSGFVAVGRDVGRIVEIEQKMAQSQRLEAIGTLAGGIAHDFNNILTAINGYTDLALRSDLNDDARESMEEVGKAAHRAADLIKQILTFSRQSKEEAVPLDPAGLLKEAVKLVRAAVPTSVQIRRDIRHTAHVMLNPSDLHRVVVNLCTNSALAMPDGGLLEVSLDEVDGNWPTAAPSPLFVPGRYVRLSIKDSGGGIPPEIKERIFEPFFTTRSDGRGSGMGLAVVHGIILGAGGFIDVSSTLGKGSEFHVYLPAVAQGAEKAALPAASPERGSERVLFVDDEISVSKLAGKSMARFGYRVSTYTDSLEALRVFESDPDGFDVVITDMTMPNLKGTDLAQRIKALRPSVPVILCTGYSEQVAGRKLEELGIDLLLMKPVLAADLTGAIRSLLDKPE